MRKSRFKWNGVNTRRVTFILTMCVVYISCTGIPCSFPPGRELLGPCYLAKVQTQKKRGKSPKLIFFGFCEPLDRENLWAEFL